MKKLFYLSIAIFLSALVTGCISNPPGVDLPGDAKYAFTIGASDINKRLASFSSWGPTDDMRTKPEISAPGVSIIAPRANGTSMGTPVNIYYTNASGTSMATPQVAGAVALLIQASLEKGSHTPSGIKAAIMNSATPIVDASGKPYNEYGQGKGLINVSAAFNLLSNPQLTAVTPSKFNTSNPNASFKIVLINDQPVVSISASSSSTWITVSPASASSIQANNVTIFNVTLNARSASLEGSVTLSGTGFSYIIPIRVVTQLDSYEPDNTLSQANWIQNGGMQSHNFNPTGDQDYMKFNATQATNYLIETSKLGDAADTVVYLYNAAGQQLAYDDDSGEGIASKILWTAPSTGIYYIKVIDYGNDAYGPNTNYDITLLALQDYENSYLFENAESEINNWNSAGLWHISQHRSYSSTHAWYYGQDETWNYNTGASNFGNLTSPTIDLTDKSIAMLSFWRWEYTEGGSTKDVREIYVTTNASAYTNWTKEYYSTGNNQYQWYKEYVPLTSYAGKTIKIRFRFDTLDAYYNNYEGWYVDNINITGPSPTGKPSVETSNVSIGSVYVSPSSTAITQITIQNMTDFGAASINMTYNGSVVQINSATLGFSGYGGSLSSNINNTIGKARFIITTTAIPGPNAPLTLLNISMQAGSSGQSPLDLTINTLVNSSGSAITPTVNDGVFGILSAIVNPGDVTGSGIVDAIDSMFLAQYVAGTRPTLPQLQAGDVVPPCGSIDAIDSMFLGQYVAGTRPNLQLCSAIAMLAYIPTEVGQTISIDSVMLPLYGSASTAITLTGMNDFGTATIDIYYDQSVVNISGATLGFTGSDGWIHPNINNTIGKSRFVITTTARPGPNSPITLVNVNLQAVGAANQISALRVVIPTLSTSEGNPVTPTVQNSTATISAGVVTGNMTIGIYRNSTGTFFLRNNNSEGYANLQLGYGASGDTPVVGDWDDNGNDTIGVYRNSNNVFYLRNSNSEGNADLTIGYGASGDIPVVGDWDGDGKNTIGVYRPSSNTFFLRNSNSEGYANLQIGYGASGDIPVVGDWDGDGKTTIGVYRPSTSTFFLRNSNSEGYANLQIGYGATGDTPVVGDWDGDGKTTIGVYRPNSNVFFLRNSNTEGYADLQIGYGASGDTPVVGDWDGQ